MKKILSIVALAALAGASVWSQDASGNAALLQKIDRLVAFDDTDVSAEYRIDKRDPGGSTSSTVAAMFRRDKTSQFLILILEPVSDKGKGYLKEGDNLWLYDPIGKSFTFTSAKERFQNSSFRNSDFNRFNFSGDYRAVSSVREKLGKFDCTVLDLEARHDRVSFPKVRLWASDDGLVRKMEDYSLSGQLMRTTAIPSYQKLGDRWLPLSMVIVDHLKAKTIQGKVEYERTTVTISRPSLKKLPDSTYSKEYLEKVSR